MCFWFLMESHATCKAAQLFIVLLLNMYVTVALLQSQYRKLDLNSVAVLDSVA